MSTSRQLTGGTNDVSPQLMHFTGAQSGADASTTTSVAIPVQRLPSGTRAQVMEVLKVYFMFPLFPAIASAAETQDTMTAFLSTVSFGTTLTVFSEPRVFAAYYKENKGAFTAAGTYMGPQPLEPFTLDLTDGAGHGILIATDNIFVQMNSTATGASNTVRVKILYRWKNISLAEYVGIVQSQQ